MRVGGAKPRVPKVDSRAAECGIVKMSAGSAFFDGFFTLNREDLDMRWKGRLLRVVCGGFFLMGFFSWAGQTRAQGLSMEDLEAYWHALYPDSPSSATFVQGILGRELLAKAKGDQCFNGIGNPYPPGPPCAEGQDKVNQGYVFGLAKNGHNLWIGTSANQLCTVLGTYLEAFGVDPPAFLTSACVCEYAESQGSPPLPAGLGDWRTPEVWVYNTADKTTVNRTPIGDPLLNETLGLRSAGTLGNVVILGGPNLAAGFNPASPDAAINLFAFRADTGAYLGSKKFPQYSDIRKWLVAEGSLYTAVQNKADQTGRVLRWDPPDPIDFSTVTIDQLLNFVEVGRLDAEGAELAYHEGRIVVTTWASPLVPQVISGVYVGPLLNSAPLPPSTDMWTKIWQATDYEPDPVMANAYFMGAVASFGEWAYWGTINFPFVSFLNHMMAYEALYTPFEAHIPEILTAFVASWRTISLFRGKNLGEATQEIEVVNGLDLLTAFDPPPPAGTGCGWKVAPNGTGPVQFGLMGFGNLFNAYTWTMATYEVEPAQPQLFVGTMDFSYMVYLAIEALLEPFLGTASPEAAAFLRGFLGPGVLTEFLGADLFRFPSTEHCAVPESINGVGNYSSYGIRTMLADDCLYLGMANPMNLFPKGGWELIGLCGTDDDGDKVAGDVEDNGPNGGDGNGDDIPDREQSTVTSLPSATGAGYITAVIVDGCDQITEVQAYQESPNDPDFEYPYGLVGFQFGFPCDSAVIRVYFHGASPWEWANKFIYRRYGLIPPDFGNPQWYTLPGVTFGAEKIKGVDVPYAEFTLTDGELGDDTWVDGVVFDIGGPGQRVVVRPVPVMGPWGIFVLMALTAFMGGYWIRRRRTGARK